ncbi:MAG: hypothetical protein K9I82_18385 [Chitinophagaceae bacterium]|nr:hypothetical protein [Chitinophagaceae bacterium]
MRKVLIFTVFVYFIFTPIKNLLAQKKNIYAIGLNFTYFPDWKKRPINLFNPELSFIREISPNKSGLISLDVFYGEFPRNQKTQIGSIIDRLNFNLKADYLISKNNTSLAFGSSFRYRNEKKILYFYPPLNPYEAVIDPNKSHFDFGFNSCIIQNISISKKSVIFIKLIYSLHTKGENPLTFGIFYCRN